jgi:hypothetical protein
MKGITSMDFMKLTRAAAAIGAVVASSVVISAQGSTQATAPAPPPSQRVTPWPVVPAQGAASSLTQGFSVVLVLGDLQGGSTPDNVPAAAKKALADMKDFLPYKSYRLLDSEWLLGSTNVATRLRGVDDQEYALNLMASAPRDGSKGLYVSFQLREAEPARTTATSAEAAVERERRLVEQIARARGTGGQNAGASTGVGAGVGVGSGVSAGVTPRASAFVISTSFTMDVGETVVVGTSRLRGGDKALIALLTAVPHGKAGAKD